MNARHGRDFPLDPGTVDHEQGLNEIGRFEPVLANEPSQGFGAPPAPRSMDL
jgi:hypothetical protein